MVIQTLGNELAVDLTKYSIDLKYIINFPKSLHFVDNSKKGIFNLYHIASNIVASYKIDINVHKIAFKMFVAF